MGKASRRKGQQTVTDPGSLPPPFAARPFEGLPGETEWVAMREIVPAATAPLTVSLEGGTHELTMASVLPMTWPALHRDTGERLVALQGGGNRGDLSRDLAAAVLAVLGAEPGAPIQRAPQSTAATPRLQDLVTETPLRLQVHDGFDFWVGAAELDDDGAASLERANQAAAPTVRLQGADSVFWCRINDRCYVRWVLPQSQDHATDTLARLHAAESSRLGEGRLLGAFRACGLLVPVWEVDPNLDPEQIPMEQMADAFAQAAEQTTALSHEQRRARDGLLSRQITLR